MTDGIRYCSIHGTMSRCEKVHAHRHASVAWVATFCLTTSLVLVFFLFVGDACAQSCTSPLCGTYTSSLGSHLTISYSGPRLLSGTFQSAKGSATGSYAFAGYACNASSLPTTLGWTIAWVNPHTPDGTSATSWTGLASKQGNVTLIYAQWHLTSLTSLDDYWKSTFSGADYFVSEE